MPNRKPYQFLIVAAPTRAATLGENVLCIHATHSGCCFGTPAKSLNKTSYTNSIRGITRLMDRWRTQLTVWNRVNCRTHEHRYFERILRSTLSTTNGYASDYYSVPGPHMVECRKYKLYQLYWNIYTCWGLVWRTHARRISKMDRLHIYFGWYAERLCVISVDSLISLRSRV